jgi:hypothetical protein
MNPMAVINPLFSFSFTASSKILLKRIRTVPFVGVLIKLTVNMIPPLHSGAY